MTIPERPACASCGDRIGVYEPFWLRRADGTLLSTTMLELSGEPGSESASGTFHLGCLAPDHPPAVVGEGARGGR